MYALNDSTRQKSARIKELQSLIRLSADYQKLKPVIDAIPKDWEKKRKAYTVEHESEINQFYAVKRKLDAALTEKKLTPKAWQAEIDRLEQEYTAESAEAKELYGEIGKLNGIKVILHDALRDQQPYEKKQDLQI